MAKLMSRPTYDVLDGDFPEISPEEAASAPVGTSWVTNEGIVRKEAEKDIHYSCGCCGVETPAFVLYYPVNS